MTTQNASCSIAEVPSALKLAQDDSTDRYITIHHAACKGRLRAGIGLLGHAVAKHVSKHGILQDSAGICGLTILQKLSTRMVRHD